MNLWTVFGKHYRGRTNTQCDSKNIRIKRRLLDSRYYLSSLIRHKTQQFCSKLRPILFQALKHYQVSIRLLKYILHTLFNQLINQCIQSINQYINSWFLEIILSTNESVQSGNAGQCSRMGQCTNPRC